MPTPILTHNMGATHSSQSYWNLDEIFGFNGTCIPMYYNHCTDVEFASFSSGEFIAVTTANLPDGKQLNPTSVHSASCMEKKDTPLVLDEIIW